MAGAARLARIVIVWPDGTRTVVSLMDRQLARLDAVDTLARVCLAARRAGAEARVEQVSEGLALLLDLAGLGREMGGEAERREDALGVEEGMDPSDPVA